MKSEYPTANADVSNPNPAGFDWPLAYEAETFLRKQVALFLEQNSFASELSARMRNDTGTDFFEWIDHLVLSLDEEHGLRESGFSLEAHVETPGGERVYEHLRATLPRVLLLTAPLGAGELASIMKAKELWRTRPRLFRNDHVGFETARRILARSLDLAGR